MFMLCMKDTETGQSYYRISRENAAGAFIKWCEKIYDREKYTLGLQ